MDTETNFVQDQGVVDGEYFTLQLCLLAHILRPPLGPFPLLPQISFILGSPFLPRSLGVLVGSGQKAQDLVDLFLSQLDAGIDQIANPVQESLSGICGSDVADSSFLEKTGTVGREAVFRDAVGAKIGTEPRIGPEKVGSRTVAVILVSAQVVSDSIHDLDGETATHLSLMSLTSSSRLAWASDFRYPFSINQKRMSESDHEPQIVS